MEVFTNTIKILTKDDGATNEIRNAGAHAATDEQKEVTTPSGPTADHQDYTSGQNAHCNTRSRGIRNGDSFDWYSQNMNDDYSFSPDGPEHSFVDEENGNHQTQTKRSRPQYEKFAKRTVLLFNLPEGVTHADITNVVRGGMLLDIYLRTHDRAASISFLEEVNAQEFYHHVKRHDLYIRGKRVCFLSVLFFSFLFFSANSLLSRLTASQD